MIYWADKGFTVGFDTKLHKNVTRDWRPALFYLFFFFLHPTVALNVSMPSGAVRINTPLLKMPILIGKYLLTGALGRHAHNF